MGSEEKKQHSVNTCRKLGSEGEQRENSLRSIRGLEGYLSSFVLG